MMQDAAIGYPTKIKERERDQRNHRKAMGLEAKVEDRHDDCGDDLSSLGPDRMVTVGLATRHLMDSDEELADQDLDRQLLVGIH